jgi:hypothetical protein
MDSEDGEEKGLLPWQQPNARFLRLEPSYHLMQHMLRAQFPADEQAAYEEWVDLFEDDWQVKQERREAFIAQAAQFKLLFIEGLRSSKHERQQPRWRQHMLYRLAALFELAALIDPTAVESLASKIAVSYEQGVVSAVLKVQAEDVLLSRQEIEDELVRLDAWWHDPTKELSERVVTLLDTPVSRTTRFLQKYSEEPSGFRFSSRR